MGVPVGVFESPAMKDEARCGEAAGAFGAACAFLSPAMKEAAVGFFAGRLAMSDGAAAVLAVLGVEALENSPSKEEAASVDAVGGGPSWSGTVPV